MNDPFALLTKSRRAALDPAILLCRDRLECSLEVGKISVSGARHERPLEGFGTVFGVAATTLAICAAGYLAHLAR